MIKVTVLYPNQEGATFDYAYWTGPHFSLLTRLLGSALKGAHADRGLGGPFPGSPAPYAAIASLLFDSVEAFQAAFAPHAAEIMGDLPKFTTLNPTVQVSEVLV